MSSATAAPGWRKLPLTLAELCIDTTLRCGQTFRWQKLDDTWICALRGRILSLRQDADHLHYRVTWPTGRKIPADDADDTEDLLRHYFSLSLDLPALYKQWADADPNFRKRAPGFQGVRMLSQDPWEALVCFICSSNNNISRISQMVRKLCTRYGTLIGHVDNQAFHDFPSPMALTAPQVESQLRALGFGYRAKYIASTARIVVQDRPPHFLNRLRNPSSPAFGAPSEAVDEAAEYKHAHEQLLQLSGVGPKVADCVCLMGLGWGGAVPVDTHVWQIAQRDYKFGGGKAKSKTFTKAMYEGVGDLFRGLWGEYAGWAHSVLFTADLRQFAEQGRTVRVRLKQELKEESGEELKEESEGGEAGSRDGQGLEGDPQNKTGSRKRRRVALKVHEEVAIKVEDAGKENVFHMSISETVAKRRRTRASAR